MRPPDIVASTEKTHRFKPNDSDSHLMQLSDAWDIKSSEIMYSKNADLTKIFALVAYHQQALPMMFSIHGDNILALKQLVQEQLIYDAQLLADPLREATTEDEKKVVIAHFMNQIVAKLQEHSIHGHFSMSFCMLYKDVNQGVGQHTTKIPCAAFAIGDAAVKLQKNTQAVEHDILPLQAHDTKLHGAMPLLESTTSRIYTETVIVNNRLCCEAGRREDPSNVAAVFHVQSNYQYQKIANKQNPPPWYSGIILGSISTVSGITGLCYMHLHTHFQLNFILSSKATLFVSSCMLTNIAWAALAVGVVLLAISAIHYLCKHPMVVRNAAASLGRLFCCGGGDVSSSKSLELK